MNFIGTLISVFFLDSFGRRKLLLRCLPAIAISMWVVSFGFFLSNEGAKATVLIYVGLIAAVFSFSVGLSTTPWAVNGEIYPLHLRGAGNALSTTVNWLSNYLVIQGFLTFTSEPVGQIVAYFVFGLVTGGCWFFVYKYLPETKNRSIEDIVSELSPEHTVKMTSCGNEN
jgi:MFS family permease